MKHKVRFVVLLLVAILAVSLATGVAMAQEKKSSPFKRAMLKLMGLTGKTIEKEVNAVGTGVKKSTDVVVEEIKDVGKLATGDMSKTKDVLVKPVTGTTEMVGETVHGVITAPIEAGKEVSGEAKEQEIK